MKILYGFVGRKWGGIIEGAMDNNVNVTMDALMSKVITIMNKFINGDVDDMFDEIIYDVFEKFRTDTGIYRTTKPAKVLNKNPYRISIPGVVKYPKIRFK